MLTARELSEKQDNYIKSVIQDAVTSIICEIITPHLESAILNYTQKSLKLEFYLESKYHKYSDEILSLLKIRLSDLGYIAQISKDISHEHYNRFYRIHSSVLFSCDIKW